MNESFRPIVHALASAESQILLLARSHPVNWSALKISLEENWQQGYRSEPSFEFQPAPDLRALRGALAQVGNLAATLGVWGNLLAQRAIELDMEAQLVEHIGASDFRSLALRRFAPDAAGSEQTLERKARGWCSLDTGEVSLAGIASDDYSHKDSLVSQLLKEMSNSNVVLPIRTKRDMAAITTVDRHCVWIRPGESLLANQARRIAVHEIRGHVLRRVAASQSEHAISGGGFANGDEDEEGRAIWLEQEADLFDASRKAELGRRYLAARACQRGATFVDAIALLLALNTPLRRALEIVMRVWRGGGLAREVIYLRAYFRVNQASMCSPLVEGWMKRGRFSIAVASLLASGELSLP